MTIFVLYDKTSGRIIGDAQGPSDDPSVFEYGTTGAIAVESLPATEHKVVNGALVPVEDGDFEDELLAEAWDRLRAKRYARLAACDWTQVPDAPVDKQAWATYRQALRDIPQQEGFPDNITWPTPPEG